MDMRLTMPIKQHVLGRSPTVLRKLIHAKSGMGRAFLTFKGGGIVPKARMVVPVLALRESTGQRMLRGVKIRARSALSQGLVGIELGGASNQDCREVRPDAPVTPLVGISKRGAAHRLTQTHRVELVGVGTQGGLDVAQGFAPSQLRSKRVRKSSCWHA